MQANTEQPAERGAALVEYAVLISGIAIVVLVSVQVLGGTVTSLFNVDELSAAPLQAEEEDPEAKTGAPLALSDSAPSESPAAAPVPVSQEATEEPSECPTGWMLVPNNMAKKNGQDVDANGDGVICLKDIPGKGKGNTNANQNIKDNNGS